MQTYNKTDQQLHLLSQIIAKANRSFVPQKEDDSHTNLAFDPVSIRIYGRWIQAKQGRFILALALMRQTFEMLDESLTILEETSFPGKTIDQLEQEIGSWLTNRGLSAEAFSQPLHFDIPDYGIADSPLKSLKGSGPGAWAEVRMLANQACACVLSYLQAEAEIRIWPHHFDTGIYVEPVEWLGLGFGLAMKDSMVGAPYLYLAGYRQDNQTFDFRQADELSVGKWVYEGSWKGATLPVSVLADVDLQEQMAMISIFIDEATSWYLSQK